MPRIRTLLLTLLAVALLAGARGAGQALASHGQLTYFEALERPARTGHDAPHAIEQLQALGVHALRVELYWDDGRAGRDQRHASRTSTRPTPRSYDWGAVRRAARRSAAACTGRCC